MPLSNYFKTRDGRWVQLHTSIAHLAPALDHPELANDPRWSDPRSARAHGGELVDAIDGIFAAMTYAEITPLLEAGNIRWEPVQTVSELAADPQAHAAGCFVEVPEDGDGSSTQVQVASPPTFYEDGAPSARALGRPPRIGEHTREVLAQLDYDEDAIARLAESGAIPLS
jgi:crotonobetainyl-CoA:carnitine CoA-transferase CaiB-like acyl-CoA transferase